MGELFLNAKVFHLVIYENTELLKRVNPCKTENLCKFKFLQENYLNNFTYISVYQVLNINHSYSNFLKLFVFNFPCLLYTLIALQ